MYHANVNVNLIVENVANIKSVITINVGVSVKIQQNIMFTKNTILRILLHVVVKMENMQDVLFTIQRLLLMNQICSNKNRSSKNYPNNF